MPPSAPHDAPAPDAPAPDAPAHDAPAHDAPAPDASAPDASAPGRHEILRELESVLRARREDAPAGSYSATLVADPELAARKIMEEAYELCVELVRPERDAQRTAEEAADVVFHVLAGLVGAGLGLDAVLGELTRRRVAAASVPGSDGDE